MYKYLVNADKYLVKNDPSEALKTAKLHEECRHGLIQYMRDNDKVQHPSPSLAPA
jgi:hypothetical protein